MAQKNENVKMSGRLQITRTNAAGEVVETRDIIYVTTFGAGVSIGSLTEAGLFNALTGGTMLCRTVYATVTKGASDTVVLTWTVTINAS